MSVWVVHCARTHIEGSIILIIGLKDSYIYYEHSQQMAVKGIVLEKSRVWQKERPFLICTKVPMGQQGPFCHGSGGRQKNGSRETIWTAITVTWAQREESLSSSNGSRRGEDGQRHVIDEAGGGEEGRGREREWFPGLRMELCVDGAADAKGMVWIWGCGACD